MKFLKTINQLAGIIVFLGLVFGGYFYLERRYALAEELEKTKQRLEEKIQADRFNTLTERIWRIEDRLEDKERKPTDIEKEELRKLKTEKEQIEKALK